MGFYIVLSVAVIAFIVWFVRTPIFRAHRRSGKGPDRRHERGGDHIGYGGS